MGVETVKTEHMDYFINIAESGSLSKTAERFFTSHQVVKKAIKNLEDELRVKLLYTSNQGSELTAAGAVFLRYAQSVRQLTGELDSDLAPFRPPDDARKQKIITFGMTPYLTDSLILNFIDEYQNRKPEITIELQSLPVQNMLEQMTQPYAVFVIPTIEEATLDGQFQQALEDNRLAFFVLAQRPLYLCTYEKTKWAQRERYTEADLNDLPIFISSNITLNTQFMKGKNQQLVNSIVAQKNLIKKGTGMTVVTKREFEFYFKGDSRYKMMPTALQPVWYICIHHKDAQLPDYVQAFLEQLKHVL